VNQDYTKFVNRVVRLFDASPEILNELRCKLTSILNGKKVEKWTLTRDNEILGGSSEAPVIDGGGGGGDNGGGGGGSGSGSGGTSHQAEAMPPPLLDESAAPEPLSVPPPPLTEPSLVIEAESNPPPAMVGGGSNCDSDMAMAGKPLTPEHLTAPTTTPVAGFPDSPNVKPRSTKPGVYRLASQSDCAKIVSEIDAGMRTSKTPSVSWRKGPYHPNNPSVKSVIAVLASGGAMSKKQIKAMSNLNPKRVSEILRELKKQEIVLLE
jgi:hypothetical protein